MGVIVVKPGTVREHEIAFDFLVTQRPILIDFVISRFVRILQQRPGAKPTRVAMRTWIHGARDATGPGIADDFTIACGAHRAYAVAEGDEGTDTRVFTCDTFWCISELA